MSAAISACASAPQAPRAAPRSDDHDHDLRDDEGESDAGDAGAPIDWSTVPYSSEPSGPRSTASYDEALSTAEAVRIDDDRPQLTDGQLAGPMRGVLRVCRVPPRAKLTIKAVVKDGRAIGVTVTVRIDAPKPLTRRPSRKALRAMRAAAKADAKVAAKLEACADEAVRAMSWPPSPRRDSFTTEL